MIRRAWRGFVVAVEFWLVWRRYRAIKRDLDQRLRVQVPVTLVRPPRPYRVPERGNRAQA